MRVAGARARSRRLLRPARGRLDHPRARRRRGQGGARALASLPAHQLRARPLVRLRARLPGSVGLLDRQGKRAHPSHDPRRARTGCLPRPTFGYRERSHAFAPAANRDTLGLVGTTLGLGRRGAAGRPCAASRSSAWPSATSMMTARSSSRCRSIVSAPAPSTPRSTPCATDSDLPRSPGPCCWAATTACRCRYTPTEEPVQLALAG